MAMKNSVPANCYVGLDQVLESFVGFALSKKTNFNHGSYGRVRGLLNSHCQSWCLTVYMWLASTKV